MRLLLKQTSLRADNLGKYRIAYSLISIFSIFFSIFLFDGIGFRGEEHWLNAKLAIELKTSKKDHVLENVSQPQC